MRPELVIAEKEFRDHLSSKRFLIIFAILVLLMVFSLLTGLDSYNKQLDDYKNAMNTTNSLVLLSLSTMPMPSVIQVFQSMVMLFTLVGMMLGISLGFDVISREKDKGSIKFLVSSPIYRDAIINGKTLGALVTLSVAMGSVFLLAIAVMLFKGIVPGMDDLLRIACFFLAAILYCMVFFAISLMMSTITRDTTTAVISSVWIAFVLIIFSFMSIQIGTAVAGLVYGPAPSTYSMMADASSYASADTSTSTMSTNNYLSYMAKEYQITDAIDMISPYGDFGGTMGMGSGGIGSTLVSKRPTDISSALSSTSLLSGGSVTQKDYSLLDSILHVQIQIISLLVELVAAFAISYVAFMRMDIR